MGVKGGVAETRRQGQRVLGTSRVAHSERFRSGSSSKAAGTVRKSIDQRSEAAGKAPGSFASLCIAGAASSSCLVGWAFCAVISNSRNRNTRHHAMLPGRLPWSIDSETPFACSSFGDLVTGWVYRGTSNPDFGSLFVWLREN